MFMLIRTHCKKCLYIFLIVSHDRVCIRYTLLHEYIHYGTHGRIYIAVWWYAYITTRHYIYTTTRTVVHHYYYTQIELHSHMCAILSSCAGNTTFTHATRQVDCYTYVCIIDTQFTLHCTQTCGGVSIQNYKGSGVLGNLCLHSQRYAYSMRIPV